MAHLFVVDDDDDHRDFLTMHFRHVGHDVVALADPVAAIELAPVLPLDLLVLDWVMPGTGGGEVCRALRAVRWLRELPILVLTAQWTVETRAEAMMAGASAVVAKPFALTELSERVSELLPRSDQPA